MDSFFQFLFKYKPFLFQKGTLGFESFPSKWLFGLLLVGCGAIIYALHRAKARPLWKAFLLVFIRWLILVILLTILFRPVLHVTTVLSRENIAALLIDDSRSMTIEDSGQQSRLESVKHVLDPKRGTFLANVERRFQTRLFRFSRDIQRLNSFDELRSEGTGTNLEVSLASILKEFGPAPLASLVLFTDGADNLSKNLKSVLSQYQSRKITVNVCALGRTDIGKDIEVTEVNAPQKVLPDSITTAVVSLRNSAFTGRKAALEVREDGKLVSSAEVTLGGKDQIQLVELNLAPKGKGLKTYKISLPPQSGERITLNNSQDFLLNVEDSKPKILYLEGTPRWEFKFIRQALHLDKNLQLVTLLRTSGSKFYRQGIESEDNLVGGFPTSKEELFQYKGLIIGSIEATFFTSEQLKLISEFVSERGGGLMMLGGRSSFDAGKYGNTPVGDLLPVVLGQRDANSSFIMSPIKFKLSSYGKSHLITRLVVDQAENEKRWNSLPEIGEFNWITSAKPGATVLAYGDRGYSNAILLAAHRYGRGRAMAFMPASSWRWQMEMPHEDDSHEVFWRQALRWLVASTPDLVTLEMDRGVYQIEDTIPFRVEVNDPVFNKLNDAEVIATVTSPDRKTSDIDLRWTVAKDGIYAGEFKPSEKGTYKVSVQARRQGKEIGKSEQYFLVTESNLEFFNAAQNKELLRRIASETGGRYYTLDDIQTLPEELTYMETANSIPQVLPLWDMPILFFLLSLLLISEWTLRKRLGMA